MKTYWFYVSGGEYEGEEFFVEATNLYEAFEIAYQYFPIDDEDRLVCYGTISEAEAEMLGYDTY